MWAYEEEKSEAVKCGKDLLKFMQAGVDGYNVSQLIDRLEDEFRKLKLGVYRGTDIREFAWATEHICERLVWQLKKPPKEAPLKDASTKEASVEVKQAVTMEYINKKRIADLQSLSCDSWDYSRLIALCRELNLAYENKCYFSAGMLVRAILDHVPPLFSARSFAEASSSYGGPKSFKSAMKKLDVLSRDLADGFLHTQIRSKESLPSQEQIDFRSLMDALLGEIVRIA